MRGIGVIFCPLLIGKVDKATISKTVHQFHSKLDENIFYMRMNLTL